MARSWSSWISWSSWATLIGVDEAEPVKTVELAEHGRAPRLDGGYGGQWDGGHGPRVKGKIRKMDATMKGQATYVQPFHLVKLTRSNSFAACPFSLKDSPMDITERHNTTFSCASARD